MQSKTIILCADDFGLTPEISQSIVQLAQLQRLSAVSCMVNMPSFAKEAKELINLQDKVQVGLHFNITQGNFLSQPNHSCFSINELLLKTHAHLLKSSFIAKEFNAQLDCYISAMGTLPDFIDGHQHVHQFPQIRPIILSLYEQRLKKHKTWIRTTHPVIALPNQKVKAFILAATGGRQLSLALKKQNIPHIPSFSGIYNFSPDTDYRSLFRQWLSLLPTTTLIMCHPGKGDAKEDPIAKARQKEFAYFFSDDFVEDCQEFQVQLATGPKPRE